MDKPRFKIDSDRIAERLATLVCRGKESAKPEEAELAFAVFSVCVEEFSLIVDDLIADRDDWKRRAESLIADDNDPEHW